jgi:hypothetical protein
MVEESSMLTEKKVLEDFITSNSHSKKELDAYYKKNNEALEHFLKLEFSFLDSIRNLEIKNKIKAVMQISDPSLFTSSMLKVDKFLISPDARLNIYNHSDLKSQFSEILKLMPLYVKFLKLAVSENKAELIRAKHDYDDSTIIDKEKELNESLEDAKQELALEKKKIAKIEEKIVFLKKKIKKTHSIILNKNDYEPKKEFPSVDTIEKQHLTPAPKKIDTLKLSKMPAQFEKKKEISNNIAPSKNFSSDYTDSQKDKKTIDIKLFKDEDIGNASSTVTGAGVRALFKYYGLVGFDVNNYSNWRDSYNRFIISLQKEGKYPLFIKLLKTAKKDAKPISKDNKPITGDIISFDVSELEKNSWVKDIVGVSDKKSANTPKKLKLLKNTGQQKSPIIKNISKINDDVQESKINEHTLKINDSPLPTLDDTPIHLKIDWDAMGEFLRDAYPLEPNGMSKPQAKLARPALLVQIVQYF